MSYNDKFSEEHVLIDSGCSLKPSDRFNQPINFKGEPFIPPPDEHERWVVAEVAKTWLRTPYHHMGRVKGAGVDCATLLAEVYQEAGVVTHAVEIPYYPIDWNMHRDEERYLNVLTQYMMEISQEEAKIGDVALYHFGRTWSHGAIIIGWPLVVHAVINKNVQLGNAEQDVELKGRKMRFFSPWGKK